MNLVELENVTRRYGKATAVDRLSFQVRRGEMFGLIGPDGAGKTTTLRMVSGLLPATAADALLTLGLRPYGDSRALGKRIGYLAQRFSLYGDLTIDENVQFFAEIHGVSNWKPRREELLERVGLKPFRGRPADKLSGGMKQKLALAATLIHVPELLILDEATTGVDPVSRREFWKILTGLVGEGLTVLLSTPYLDEAERCHRVALIESGRLLALDEPSKLRRSLSGTLVEVVASPLKPTLETLRAFPGARDVETFGEAVHVRFPHLGPSSREAGETLADVQRALEKIPVQVRAVSLLEPSLEDVFISRLRERTGEHAS